MTGRGTTLRRRKGVARAWAGLVVSVGVAVVAGAGAWKVEAPPVARGELPVPPSLAELPDRPGRRDARAVLAGIEAAPFRPDRTRPDRRYVMPSERRAAPSTAGRPARTTLRLTGLVVRGSGGGLAAIARGGQPSRLFTIGTVIDGFELVAVEPGAVTLQGQDTTLVLEIWKPGGGVR